ncbi:MAG TPA: penicillin-binding protein 1C [Hyphomicrobiales bacterium]|nr:penicillin-binding protein 1C [Hyphomicrobiales bacterium]
MSLRLSIAAAVVLAAVIGAAVGFREWRDSRKPPSLDAAAATSVMVVDRDGRLLRPFATPDGRWRLPVAAAEVDPRFIAFLKAYEDRRFGRHDGVDWRALARAAAQAALHGRIVSGGSTLTMQVVRLLDGARDRTLSRKIGEIGKALALERAVGRKRVLDLYLALAPYGGNVEGVRAASLAYFGKEPTHLSTAEAALLVALPQSPETRRPDRFPEAARAARNRVIARLAAAGVIGAAEAAHAEAAPVPRSRRIFPMLAAHAAEEAVAAAPGRRVVRLTIERTLQESLEALARERAQALGPRISVAILAVDAASGAVLAHVGSADYFDDGRAGHVDQARALRSPGSALKPFIYGMAFDDGIARPDTLIDDRPVRFGSYQPTDFDGGYQGTVTVARALQQSLNVPAVELLSAVGPVRFLARLGAAGARIALPEGETPGLAVGLGGLGIDLWDMASLYTALARGGQPIALHEVDGAPPAAAERPLFSRVAAWQVAETLIGAPAPDNALPGRIAYKTGTSYGYRDAWAIGFDGAHVIAVWVGRPDGQSSPGLVGRAAAGPILFDAFSRLAPATAALIPPPEALAAAAAPLPPALRRFQPPGAPAPQLGPGPVPLQIAFPPDGAVVDAGADGGAVVLRAAGGVPPFTWLADGRPVGPAERRRDLAWPAPPQGFSHLTVLDATGASASAAVRIEQ